MISWKGYCFLGMALAILLAGPQAFGQGAGSGLDYNYRPRGTIDLDEDRPMSPEDVPHLYNVKSGDTLWDICDAHYNNPWLWPKIWSYNAKVTNPNWIYPGDVLVLRPTVGVGGPPGMGARRKTVYTTTILTRGDGFITQKELKRAGSIRFSRENHRLLSEWDVVYGDFKDPAKVQAGQRYSIFKVLGEVEHPKTGDVYGYKIQVVGALRVVKPQAKGILARAVIIKAMDPIERGDLLLPLMPDIHMVEPRKNRVAMKGVVLDTLRGVDEIGENQVVFIDKGRKDGVLPGNVFDVVVKKDYYEDDMDEEDVRTLPREDIASLMVIFTRQRTSTCLVVQSSLEVHRGYKAIMIKGRSLKEERERVTWKE